MLLDIQEILKMLPHAYPFLLVDRILEVEPGKRIVGIKNVTYNEPFFPGHFPGSPVPHPKEQIILVATLAGLMLVAVLLFWRVRRYSLAHPEALDRLVHGAPSLPPISIRAGMIEAL